jgi:hypothetical protein
MLLIISKYRCCNLQRIINRQVRRIHIHSTERLRHPGFKRLVVGDRGLNNFGPRKHTPGNRRHSVVITVGNNLGAIETPRAVAPKLLLLRRDFLDEVPCNIYCVAQNYKYVIANRFERIWVATDSKELFVVPTQKNLGCRAIHRIPFCYRNPLITGTFEVNFEFRIQNLFRYFTDTKSSSSRLLQHFRGHKELNIRFLVNEARLRTPSHVRVVAERAVHPRLRIDGQQPKLVQFQQLFGNKIRLQSRSLITPRQLLAAIVFQKPAEHVADTLNVAERLAPHFALLAPDLLARLLRVGDEVVPELCGIKFGLCGICSTEDFICGYY